MTRALSRLASPNTDLAVDRNRRVYKLKADGWHRLDYWLPTDAALLEGRGRSESTEVAA